MSARKRHSKTRDFMRLFVAMERSLLCDWPFGYTREYPMMLAKCIKRGYIERDRSQGYYNGNFRPIKQRRNYYRSTRKGRRLVYGLDDHNTPSIRKHSWNFEFTPFTVDAMHWQDQRIQKELTISSKRVAKIKRP